MRADCSAGDRARDHNQSVGYLVRVLVFLVVMAGGALFLYVYRRRTNQILVIVLFSYAVGVGSRLWSAQDDGEVLRTAILAIGGLLLLWGGMVLVARWVDRWVRSADDDP